jgi:hypothetical protein
MVVASDLDRYSFYILTCEHGPGSEVSVIDGLDEDGSGWAETSLVERFDGVSYCPGGDNAVDVSTEV